MFRTLEAPSQQWPSDHVLQGAGRIVLDHVENSLTIPHAHKTASASSVVCAGLLGSGHVDQAGLLLIFFASARSLAGTTPSRV